MFKVIGFIIMQALGAILKFWPIRRFKSVTRSHERGSISAWVRYILVQQWWVVRQVNPVSHSSIANALFNNLNSAYFVGKVCCFCLLMISYLHGFMGILV